jgi:RNA polymerase sigma factor (sigma-70 family)
MDDFALLTSYVRTGSEADFALLVNRHAGWVYSVCRRHAGEAAADDVTQAVFATLARKARHLRPGTSISGWLFKTARYASATARKLERRRRKHEQEAAAMKPDISPSPAGSQWQEILPSLDDAVARLSEGDRRAILLRFYQGLSHQDAATLLEISPAAVQRRLSRAVEKLRARLQPLSFVIAPAAFEQGLHSQLTAAAPAHVVSASISAAVAGPTAKAALIMKGTLAMQRLYRIKVAGLAACLVALVSTIAWRVIPVRAAQPELTSAQLAQAANIGTVEFHNVEFHIVADANTANTADLKAMQSRLAPGGLGPQPQAGDTIRWVEVAHPEDFDRLGFPPVTTQWNDRHFMPVLMTADASMDQNSTPGWTFAHAFPTTTQNGARALGFVLDTRGAWRFGDLTTRWYNRFMLNGAIAPRPRLAIIFDNKIINAPGIAGPITGGSGIITGGGSNGMTDDEMSRLTWAMLTGSAPPLATKPSGSAGTRSPPG